MNTETQTVNRILLKPVDCTPEIAEMLEKRNLVTFVRHSDHQTRKTVQADFIKGPDFPAVRHGFHSVTITYTEIKLSSHPEGEDEIVFLWDSVERAKPLYFVFALDKRVQYLGKMQTGVVDASDYLAVRFPINDPRFSAFVVWSGTVHCELTNGPHDDRAAPSFFVLEPQDLTVMHTNERVHGVDLHLDP